MNEIEKRELIEQRRKIFEAGTQRADKRTGSFSFLTWPFFIAPLIAGEEFLAATRAAVAVISVGARNPFRHPTPEALGRLEAAGARIYRTDRDGAVILETDGATLWITRWASGTVERFELDPER